MRHEQHLLSEAESRKVIDELNAWCRRTGTNYNKLVTAARVNTSTRCLVRRGRRLTLATVSRLRMTMQAYPHGIAKAEHKARLSRARQEFVRSIPPIPQRVDRTPCPRCGARKDIGCEHWARFECGAYA